MTRRVSPAPTVLLVEASQDDRAMYCTYLRKHGFIAVEIGTTDDALKSAVNADVIVTGVHVPGSFDGVELVRRVRAEHGTRHTPILVLTASPWLTVRRAAMAAGCDSFLPKPCAPDELVRAIRRALAPGIGS